ncbi:MAG: hypothetical protein LBC10_05225 [Deltaproteobacteria bacterium]|jgi:hypothetical protein|nr:hypothetical protein [Deltaproteobacteria bacterium]
MADNYYQQYFDAQKAMFDAWQKHTAPMFAAQNAGGEGGEAHNHMDFYQKLLEAPNDFWKKTSESYKSYHAIFELWKTLNENKAPLDSQAALDIYNIWAKQNFALIRNNLLPSMPGYMQNITERIFETIETSSASMADSIKAWAANDESLKKAVHDALLNGPKGYIGFLEAWQQSYETTLGKFANAPTFGRDMDFWKLQKSSFDRFVKFNTAAAKFYASLFEIAQNATRQVLEEYAAMQAEGTQPKTFEEFYKYWSKTITATYEKVLLSDNLSALSGNMVDAMSRFKVEYDKLCAFYLDHIPVPKKSDMDDLYKTVYELKKEIRALKKEIHANERRSA